MSGATQASGLTLQEPMSFGEPVPLSSLRAVGAFHPPPAELPLLARRRPAPGDGSRPSGGSGSAGGSGEATSCLTSSGEKVRAQSRRGDLTIKGPSFAVW